MLLGCGLLLCMEVMGLNPGGTAPVTDDLCYILQL